MILEGDLGVWTKPAGQMRVKAGTVEQTTFFQFTENQREVKGERALERLRRFLRKPGDDVLRTEFLESERVCVRERRGRCLISGRLPCQVCLSSQAQPRDDLSSCREWL